MTQKAACLRPFSVYNHVYEAQSRQRGVEYVFNALSKNAIRPFVDTVYPLAEFRQAFEDQVKASGRRGKIVISTR